MLLEISNRNLNEETITNQQAVDQKAIDDGSESPSRKDKGQLFWLEAQCLLQGHGIEPNNEFAMTWFERSAKQGQPKAMYSLGCMYEEGVGVRVNKTKALEYFQRASNLGEPTAQYKLAKYYQRGGYQGLGDDGKPNAAKAFKLLEQSAEQDCREGLREMGYIYEKGGMQEGVNGPFS